MAGRDEITKTENRPILKAQRKHTAGTPETRHVPHGVHVPVVCYSQ